MRIGVYARVSTKDKDQTNENQLLRLIKFCEDQDWEYKIYQDKAKGKDPRRENLARIMQDLDGLDGILVLRVDRFGRSLLDLKQKVEEIRRKGKFFMALDQGIKISDERDPMGSLLFNFLCAIAEFESELISDRVKDGMERARSEGKRISKPSILEKRNIDIGKIEAFRKEGKSIREISQLIGIKKSTLHGYLHPSRLV